MVKAFFQDDLTNDLIRLLPWKEPKFKIKSCGFLVFALHFRKTKVLSASKASERCSVCQLFEVTSPSPNFVNCDPFTN